MSVINAFVDWFIQPCNLIMFNILVFGASMCHVLAEEYVRQRKEARKEEERRKELDKFN